MVNIDPDKPILNIPEPTSNKIQPKEEKSNFDAIFRQTIDSKPIKTAKTESAGHVTQIRPPQFSNQSLPSGKMIVDRVQQLIDTLGIYQQKLIDPSATLKDIQPLVQKMSVQRESLTTASRTAEGQDGLNAIVSQSLTLVSMEIAKFNSGHYNDG